MRQFSRNHYILLNPYSLEMKFGLRGSVCNGRFDFIITDIFKGVVDPAVFLPGFLFPQPSEGSVTSGQVGVYGKNDSSYGIKHQNQLQYAAPSLVCPSIFLRRCGVRSNWRIVWLIVSSNCCLIIQNQI